MNSRRGFIKSGALSGPGALLLAGQARARGHLSWRVGSSLSGAAPDKLEERALRELKLFTDWLTANTAKGSIGEFGFPGDRSKLDEYNSGRTPRRFKGDYGKWNNLAETWLKKADEAKLRATIRATGEWWGDYSLAVYKRASESAPSVDTVLTLGSKHVYSTGIRLNPRAGPGSEEWAHPRESRRGRCPPIRVITVV